MLIKLPIDINRQGSETFGWSLNREGSQEIDPDYQSDINRVEAITNVIEFRMDQFPKIRKSNPASNPPTIGPTTGIHA